MADVCVEAAGLGRKGPSGKEKSWQQTQYHPELSVMTLSLYRDIFLEASDCIEWHSSMFEFIRGGALWQQTLARPGVPATRPGDLHLPRGKL
jgi:hypothetical protein